MLIHFFSTHFTYNAHGLMNIGASLISLLIGILVLMRDPRSKKHISFFFLTLSGTLWLFCYAMIHLASNEALAYRWLSLAYLLAVPYISPVVYLFSIYWTNRPSIKIAKGGFILAFCFSLIMFFNAEVLCSFKDHSWGRLNLYRDTVAARLFYHSISIFFLIYATLAFRNIFKAWREEKGYREKIQYRNFVVGFFIGYSASTDFLVAGGINIPHTGYISYTLFLLTVAYTIIRHQFFEINLALKKLSLIIFIYFILLCVLAPVSIPIFFRAQSLSISHSLFWMFGVSIGAGLVFSTGPLIYAYLIRNNFWLRNHLTTGLTHELKSPLSNIQSSIEMIHAQLEKGETDKVKSLEYVEIVERNAERLESFVKDLLSVAKIQDDQVSIAREEVNLPLLIEEIILGMKPTADRNKVKFISQLEKDLYLFVDVEKINQVVTNLVSNAIKFSDGGIITVTLKKMERDIIFSIQDEGRGIHEKFLSQVFDRFFQADKTVKGTGIGLTIAKAWIEAHGGKIWAESPGLGKGSKFSFTLPQ